MIVVYVVNNNVGLRVYNDGADLYKGNPRDGDFFYFINGHFEGTDSSGRAVTAHFQSPDHFIKSTKNLIKYGDDCFSSSKTFTDVCLSGVKSLHFAF